MKTRIVYIRDPEKNYQFVNYGTVFLRPGSKYPYSIEIEGERYVWEGET